MKKGVKTSKKQKKTTAKNAKHGSEKCISILLYHIVSKRKNKRK